MPVGQDFFKYGLSQLVGTKRPRILISGGADTGLLAIAASVFEGTTTHPQFVFSDRCLTTIQQNRLFAELRNLDCSFIEASILELEIEPVDAVLGHSFLNFFEVEERVDVIRKWHSLLKPNGMTLLFGTVSTDGTTSALYRDPLPLQKRAKKLREKAKDIDYLDDLDEFEATVAQFGLNRSFTRMTEEILRSYFSAAELLIELAVYDNNPVSSGPQRHDNSPRKMKPVGIMARRAEN